jgi:hypothetical protein
MLSIDFSNFSDYAERLDELGADLKKVFADAMEQAAETVQEDTLEALSSAYLPADGIYSKGITKQQVITNAKVEWSGYVGEIGLGFDKSKPGAGGFLITGTPRMQPDYKLEDIYGRRKYENQIKKDIEEVLQAEIDRIMGG